jgi:hypothetical protein
MATVLFVSLWLVPSARADLYDYDLAAGPVIAMRDDGGLALGWELGGAFGHDLASRVLSRVNVGGSYALFGTSNRGAEDLSVVHYVVWEPWFIVGGTLGVAIDKGARVHPAFGAWEGFPIPLSTDDEIDSRSPHRIFLSIAFGFRWWGTDVNEFYLTPKIGLSDWPSLHS